MRKTVFIFILSVSSLSAIFVEVIAAYLADTLKGDNMKLTQYEVRTHAEHIEVRGKAIINGKYKLIATTSTPIDRALSRGANSRAAVLTCLDAMGEDITGEKV